MPGRRLHVQGALGDGGELPPEAARRVAEAEEAIAEWQEHCKNLEAELEAKAEELERATPARARHGGGGSSALAALTTPGRRRGSDGGDDDADSTVGHLPTPMPPVTPLDLEAQAQVRLMGGLKTVQL
jgi:hypothetical protein